MQRLIDFMNSSRGSIVISAILGLGLATLFRQTCRGDCVVVRAPDLDKLRNYIYEIDGTCYKYTARAVKCSAPPEAQKS